MSEEALPIILPLPNKPGYRIEGDGGFTEEALRLLAELLAEAALASVRAGKSASEADKPL